MAKEMRIFEELCNRFDKCEKGDDGYKVITITFKATGNVWTLKYRLQWCGNRYGFKRHCVAIHNGEEKHYRDVGTLSRAIVAGYIK